MQICPSLDSTRSPDEGVHRSTSLSRDDRSRLKDVQRIDRIAHDGESVAREEFRVLASVSDIRDRDMAARFRHPRDLAQCLLALRRLVNIVNGQARNDDVEARVLEWAFARHADANR